MSEQTARVGDIELAYESFGSPEDPALLLVMGLGTQMLGWHEEFCELLAERGFFVVRFDNRDVGRSTWIEDGPRPDLGAALAGDASSAGYLLRDMAADGFGLLDALGIERAHVVGASMGGMIAQTMAIDNPERVLSLTSIMSTTGERSVGQPSPEGTAALLRAPSGGREEFAQGAVDTFSAIGSKGFPIDEETLRERALQSYDRGYNPLGISRQLLAIIASGDRTEALRKLDVPALVIHGDVDALVNISGGRATAEAIPGARLEVIEGMGHDLPRAAWPRIVDAIAENAERAVTAAGSS
jgi:pimeloyl-ACP methyl ester carboxylesterase